MATALLRSHNSIYDQFSPRFSRNTTYANHKSNQSHRCRRRKRSPCDGSRRSNRDSLSTSPHTKVPVMGQVKILKRGEELKARMLFGKEKLDLGLQLCSTNRLGPDPDIVQKQIRVPDLYAGPTSTVLSPHPSSLPFPATLIRRNVAS